MAHKSKTQRAKATAAKANRRDRQEREAVAAENVVETAEASAEESKGGLFKKKEDTFATSGGSRRGIPSEQSLLSPKT